MTANKRKYKRVNPFIIVISLVEWLNTSIIKIDRRALTHVLKVIQKIKCIYDTRGKAECIRYTKSLRLVFLKYLFELDQELQPTGDPIKLPKILRSYRSIIEKKQSYPFIRLALSSLYVTRFIRLEAKPSLDTITKRPGYAGDPHLSTPLMIEFLKDLGVNRRSMGKVPKHMVFKNFHMTSKSGPQGHALWSSYLDARLIDSITSHAISVVGGEKLGRLLSMNLSASSIILNLLEHFTFRKKVECIRRISVLQDKEGKSREIAILDYWSQCALKPLHHYLYKWLSKIEQDCTHNQSKLLKKLKLTQGSSFHSVDLTAATDRFPIEFEWLLLRIWFGMEFAQCWKHLMVGLPFKFGKQSVNYRTGNPMGAYSSWATFAMCHHFFVWVACKRANRKWKRCPYMMLGDDIVIADDLVAKHYKELLSEWDIPYSSMKTHTSKHGYEFAKQIILHGKNVSPFPLAALYERRNSPIESVGIIVQEMWKKDWTTDVGAPIAKYLIQVQGWKRPRYRAFKPKLDLTIALLFYLQDRGDLGTPLLKYVSAKTGRPWSVAPMHLRKFNRWLSMKTVHKLFEESRDRITDNANKLPLGQLAQHVVMAFTAAMEAGRDCFDLIESIPFLQVYGQAEESFLKIQQPLEDTGLEDIGSSLRKAISKVDIPLSDRDFYIRNRDVIVIQALKASNIMIEIIRRSPQIVTWDGQLDRTLPWYEYTLYEEEDLLEDVRMPRRVKPEGDKRFL